MQGWLPPVVYCDCAGMWLVLCSCVVCGVEWRMAVARLNKDAAVDYIGLCDCRLEGQLGAQLEGPPHDIALCTVLTTFSEI